MIIFRRTAAAVAILLYSCVNSFANATHDGQYYFEKMRESITAVLAESQSLINTNPDGSVKSPNLAPEAVYRSIYQTFKTVVGKDFNPKDLEGNTDPERIAHAVTALLQAARDTIAKLQDEINAEADGSVRPKKFIPAVFGRLTLERFGSATGAIMKQTTLGKGEFGVRNPYNAPTDWEAAALQRFVQPDWPLNQGYGITVGNEYRYVKPLYIKKGCLPCHGTPIGERDVYGHPKEGYKEGEVRGGISLAIPLR